MAEQESPEPQKRGDLLTQVLAVLLLLEIAAGAGLAGYLILTGKLSREQVRLAYLACTGELTHKTLEKAEKWDDHRAEEARKEEAKASGADAEAKLAATSVEAEAARLGIERLLEELKDRERLLQMRFEEYKRKRTQLEEIEQRLDRKIAMQEESGGDENFQKMLAIMKVMKPKDLKEVLLQMDDYTVVEVLKGLGPRTAAKVLREYTSPSEVDMKRRYMKMISEGDVAVSGATAGG